MTHIYDSLTYKGKNRLRGESSGLHGHSFGHARDSGGRREGLAGGHQQRNTNSGIHCVNERSTEEHEDWTLERRWIVRKIQQRSCIQLYYQQYYIGK